MLRVSRSKICNIKIDPAFNSIYSIIVPTLLKAKYLELIGLPEIKLNLLKKIRENAFAFDNFLKVGGCGGLGNAEEGGRGGHGGRRTVHRVGLGVIFPRTIFVPGERGITGNQNFPRGNPGGA